MLVQNLMASIIHAYVVAVKHSVAHTHLRTQCKKSWHRRKSLQKW